MLLLKIFQKLNKKISSIIILNTHEQRKQYVILVRNLVCMLFVLKMLFTFFNVHLSLETVGDIKSLFSKWNRLCISPGSFRGQ